MVVDMATLLTWGIPAVVGIVMWAVRQEGRINAHDRQHADHEKRHNELREDISYIRSTIDSALHRWKP